ncbi:DUF2063 domain-containing protein [Flavobacterium sp. RHBU_3]|uniref:HvfC/BufC N-terminal domain-containing protein n=1 Tax=Flavobacterium sp. RHBU_3 TaxID=3391184 RepID=UPI003985101C
MLKDTTHTNMSLLAEYCRTGDYEAITGVNHENVHHYRRLVFNNVLDSITAAYPLARKLLKRKKWEQLVQRFFASHKVQHPQIWMMPEEFKDYVIQTEKELTDRFFCLPDLLELEWQEVAVFMMPDAALPSNRVTGYYYLNPEIRLLRTEYPLHLKKASMISTEDKGVYFVSLHRHPETGAVHFTNLSIPFVAVLEQMDEQPLTKENITAILSTYTDTETALFATDNFIEQSVHNHLIFI